MKKEHKEKSTDYQEIHMPKSTPTGFYIGAISFVFGFAMIWHMFWLAIVSGLGIIAVMIARLYEKKYRLSRQN